MGRVFVPRIGEHRTGGVTVAHDWNPLTGRPRSVRRRAAMARCRALDAGAVCCRWAASFHSATCDALSAALRS